MGYYSALNGFSGDDVDIFQMGLHEFHQCMKDCKMPDKTSNTCTNQDLDNIFRTCGREEKKPNGFIEDGCLMRFEWIQALIQISAAKHGQKASCPTIESCVDAFFRINVHPNLPAHKLFQRDMEWMCWFRVHFLYSHHTHDQLQLFLGPLRNLFHSYCGKDQSGGGGAMLSLEEWMQLAEDMHFTSFVSKGDLLVC